MKFSRRLFLKYFLSASIIPVANPLASNQRLARVVWHGNREVPTIALTFDDCWNYELLLKLEAVLERNFDLRVTFFPTGIALLNLLEKDPKIWQRLSDMGHEFGYHGPDHTLPSNLDYNQTVRDFEKWQEALSTALGFTRDVKYARPPYGDLCWSFLRVCYDIKITPVMWSANWSRINPVSYQKLGDAQNGDIALFHLRGPDIDSLTNTLMVLKTKSLRMVNISTLLSKYDTFWLGKQME